MDARSLQAQLVTHKGQRLAIISLQGRLGQRHGFPGYDFNKSLSELGNYDVLYTIFDSAGGSVVDSWLIYDFLMAAPAPRPRSLVMITGQCSGDAVLIPLAFDQILMRPTAYIQFQPIVLSRPLAGQRTTRFIARMVAERAGSKVEEVMRWMDKNREFTADECLARSLCDAIV
jgi:ATP-dependent protease ClpP protease subunit